MDIVTTVRMALHYVYNSQYSPSIDCAAWTDRLHLASVIVTFLILSRQFLKSVAMSWMSIVHICQNSASTCFVRILCNLPFSCLADILYGWSLTGTANKPWVIGFSCFMVDLSLSQLHLILDRLLSDKGFKDLCGNCWCSTERGRVETWSCSEKCRDLQTWVACIFEYYFFLRDVTFMWFDSAAKYKLATAVLVYK